MHREITINPTYQGWSEQIRQIPAHRYAVEQTYCHRRNVVERASLNGLDVVIKRYKRPNWINKVVYTLFRPPKAVRAYRAALRLIGLGIDTPDPVACITVRRGLLFTDSWYISRYCPAPPIGDVITEEDRTRLDTLFEQNIMLQDFRKFALTLFGKGIYQRDFNRGNFLAEARRDGGYSFSMVDINRVRFLGHHPSAEQIAMSWVRFGADLTPGIVERLTLEAGKALGIDEVICRAEAEKAVRRGFRIERRRQIKRRWRNRKRM